MLQEKLQAQSLAAMGDVRAAQGRDLEALALFERAFALNYDKSDGNIGMCMHNWGQVLSKTFMLFTRPSCEVVSQLLQRVELDERSPNRLVLAEFRVTYSRSIGSIRGSAFKL